MIKASMNKWVFVEILRWEGRIGRNLQDVVEIGVHLVGSRTSAGGLQGW